jgi:HK97 family phage prohead protease
MPPAKLERDFNQRHMFALVKDVAADNPNLIHAVISTDEIDRYDEVVEPAAIKAALPAFLTNPVVLGCHQPRLANGEPPVIGNVLPESIRIGEHQIDADILFDDDELSAKYARKYNKKVMRAFSIGFKPLKGEQKEISSKRTWVWTEIELLEVSAVAVPANRQALARAMGFSLNEDIYHDILDAIQKEEPNNLLQAILQIMHEDMNRLGELFNQLKKALSEDIVSIEQKLDEIKSLLIADPDGLSKRFLLDDPDELPDTRGDGNNIERQLNRIQNSFKE